MLTKYIFNGYYVFMKNRKSFLLNMSKSDFLLLEHIANIKNLTVSELMRDLINKYVADEFSKINKKDMETIIYEKK